MRKQVLRIRNATLDDVARLREMEQGVVAAERPFDPSIKGDGKPLYYDLEDLITNEQSCLLVTEDDGRVIASGYAKIRESKAYHTHDIHAYLGFMFVEPDYRGQGVIIGIIDELAGWSKSKGAVDLFLDVYMENKAAVRAYEKYGFEPRLVDMRMKVD